MLERHFCLVVQSKFSNQLDALINNFARSDLFTCLSIMSCSRKSRDVVFKSLALYPRVPGSNPGSISVSDETYIIITHQTVMICCRNRRKFKILQTSVKVYIIHI